MEQKPKKKKWWIVAVVLIALIIIVPNDDSDTTGTSTETTEMATTEERAEATTEKEEKPEFTMYSTDTVGATKHTLVGMDNVEPTGKYRIVCTSGHGCLNINDDDLYFLAIDDYLGKEQSGLVFEDEITIELNGSDELMARNYNSSDFKIEFYIVD